MSELAFGLMLDPRVHRVVTTTLTAQSLDGTCHLLRLLGELAPSRLPEHPLPSIIISQIPDELQRGSALSSFREQLLTAASAFLEDESLQPIMIESGFDHKLFVLPSKWDQVRSAIASSSRYGRDQATNRLDWGEWIVFPAIEGSAFHV